MNPKATVCGWGSKDKGMKNELECAEVSAKLHCIIVTLHGCKICQKRIKGGDYQRKLLCGMSDNSEKITTLVNTS